MAFRRCSTPKRKRIVSVLVEKYPVNGLVASLIKAEEIHLSAPYEHG